MLTGMAKNEPGVSNQGLMLQCSPEGRIEAIIYDGLGCNVQVGQPFASIVDGASFAKALSFFATLQKTGAEFDWELNISSRLGLGTLHFTGGLVDGRILIVATCSRGGEVALYEELVRINNEQANLLRSLFRERNETESREREQTDNTLEHLLSLNNDLSTMQRELAKKNAALNRLNDEKSLLIGIVAHDLRTPLGVISGYAQFLGMSAADRLTKAEKEFLQAIEHSSTFMQRMIEGLLSISAADTGKLTLERDPTDVVTLLRHNATMNATLAQSKEIGIDIETPEALPPLEIDGAKVEQVLNNLLSNAIKYSPRGSRVAVALKDNGKEILVTVTDQGQGIKPGEMACLFKPFSRTSTSSTEGEPSVGLGLSICKRIVEGHGGRIGADSTHGQGSTFWFTLPHAPSLPGA